MSSETNQTSPVMSVTTNLFCSSEHIRSVQSVHLKRTKITPMAKSIGRYELFLDLRYKAGYRIRFHYYTGDRRVKTQVLFSTISFMDTDYIFSLLDYTIFYMKDKWLPDIMQEHLKVWSEILYPSSYRHHPESLAKYGTTSARILEFHRALHVAVSEDHYWSEMKFAQSPRIMASLLMLEDVIRKDGRIAHIYRDSTREKNIVNGKDIDVQMLLHIWQDKSMPRLPQKVQPVLVAADVVEVKEDEEQDEKQSTSIPVSLPQPPSSSTNSDIKIEIDLREDEAELQAEIDQANSTDVYGSFLTPHPCPRCLQPGCDCWQWTERLYENMVDTLTDTPSSSSSSQQFIDQTQFIHSVPSTPKQPPTHN